jgi:hypothetical protein
MDLLRADAPLISDSDVDAEWMANLEDFNGIPETDMSTSSHWSKVALSACSLK